MDLKLPPNLPTKKTQPNEVALWAKSINIACLSDLPSPTRWHTSTPDTATTTTPRNSITLLPKPSTTKPPQSSTEVPRPPPAPPVPSRVQGTPVAKRDISESTDTAENKPAKSKNLFKRMTANFTNADGSENK
eukprot:c5910_g1_i2.p1 GENE.c5910_g1_i2~~c5910_g1_i2.p1  ORF type:complete len:133 (+),score=18.45 c5910_g1_i2:46-444(+)